MRRIGFDRMIKIEWLDAVAGKMQNERDVKEMRGYLHNLLKNEHPAFEARRKTVSVLMRTWFLVPQEHIPMRDKALHIIDETSSQERLLIHWGMLLLAYPFFRDTVTIIGGLFSLQGKFSISQVFRKMEQSWGQRTTVKRAIRRVVRSLYEWGVIEETTEKGVYLPSAKVDTLASDLELWFIEAVLRSGTSDFIAFEHLHNMSCAFPFSLSVSISDLFESGKFEISLQGLNKGIITAK